MKKPIQSSLTTQYIVLFGTLLLMANIILGFILLQQTSSTVQFLIRKNMLDLSNTAADLVDGDTLGALTADDVGSSGFNDILLELSAFQNNADIEFIYAVRRVTDDRFIFTVDPDPVDPGQFGEEVVVTPAMRTAAYGTADVDDVPAQDRWGNFYSAFSPVFDSNGDVAGIIGVDFNSAWYNAQLWRTSTFVVIMSLLFTLVGVSGCIMVNSRVRTRIGVVRMELSKLSDDVETLMDEIQAGYGEPSAAAARGAEENEDQGDELFTLNRKIRAMHREMERYLDYMQTRVNTDALTRVGNTTAYQARQKEMAHRIQDGTASFTLVMFDINNLKHINDRYGHTGGDRIIRAAAAAIAEGFGERNTYRIGGDEFIAVAEHVPPGELENRLASLDKAVAAYNRDPEHIATLSISRGQAAFQPEQDRAFRDVFIRADGRMYECKNSFHSRDQTVS